MDVLVLTLSLSLNLSNLFHMFIRLEFFKPYVRLYSSAFICFCLVVEVFLGLAGAASILKFPSMICCCIPTARFWVPFGEVSIDIRLLTLCPRQQRLFHR